MALLLSKVRGRKRKFGSFGKKRALIRLLCGVACLLIVALFSAYVKNGANNSEESVVSRSLVEHSSSEGEEDECHLSKFEDSSLGAFVYACGVLYMFVGLAIICDEFFVESLDIISEKLKLSEDVAGATFMAAGGSAPELLTSTMDAFGSQSSLGLGAIVGSAIFNILIIIGATAFCAGAALKLDWRPLARDSTFYSFSIILLAITFYNGEITTVEAVGMIGCYGLYVLFMFFNEPILNLCGKKDKHELPITSGAVAPERDDIGSLPSRAESIASHASHLSHGSNKSKFSVYRAASARITIRRAHSRLLGPGQNRNSGFRGPAFSQSSLPGAVNQKQQNPAFAVSTMTLSHSKSDAVVGSPPSFFGVPERKEPQKDIESVLIDAEESTIPEEDTPRTPNVAGDSQSSALKVPRDTPIAWSPSEPSDVNEMKENSDDVPRKVSNPINAVATQSPPVKDNIHSDGNSPFKSLPNGLPEDSTSSVAERVHQPDAFKDDTIEEEDESSSWYGIIYTILAFPLLTVFKLTVPDCKKNFWKRFYLLSFFMSIAWIAVLCYWMVHWVEALGCYFNIDAAVMGLTVVAAGTSVPDALSSIIVAREGMGDMAVSNAIGSNVFDILLGLGLPWLMSIIYNGENVVVDKDGVVDNVIFLFIILVIVISLLAINKWTLTKRIAILFLILYVINLLYSLVIKDLMPWN